MVLRHTFGLAVLALGMRKELERALCSGTYYHPCLLHHCLSSFSECHPKAVSSLALPLCASVSSATYY